MKKRVFGMIAALFAFMLLLPIGARAADNVYAILYDDGALVFQNGNAPESGRAVKETYEVDLTAGYTWDSIMHQPTTPWYNKRSSVRIVDFTTKISPNSTAYWFYECDQLRRVDNIQNLDTAKVTDMDSMFYDCSELRALDVSLFDTSKVTNMNYTFYYCERLKELDVSHFDTANVTSMHFTFSYCRGLTELDVSRFNTSKVTDMWGIFSYCKNLTALDVSHFDTSNVTNMSEMFCECENLTALDVSRFDTSNVTAMSNMFRICHELTELDVSHFDTGNVTAMSGVFENCKGLTELDVSHFDTADVKYMSRMFSHCSGLTELDISSFDTAQVMIMEDMFRGCSSLKTIYASNRFKTISVPETETSWGNSIGMFFDCTALVGGNGAKYDASHTKKEYARIDMPDAPGYFTYKAAPVAYAITAATPDASGKLSVTLTNSDAATFAVAYFDASGKFVSADVQGVSANAGTAESSIPANAKTARVILFDNECRPLCEPYQAAVR